MQKIAVIYGGRSAEHEVSIVSGKSVAANLDKSKFTTQEVLIDRSGDWLIDDKKVGIEETVKNCDIVFPVLHGTYGEDGKVQGLFEMLNIPYVGCGVTESAIGMDKEFSKLIWERYGLLTAKFVAVTKAVWKSEKDKINEEINQLKLPLFIKPANFGSSIGVNKVKKQEEIGKYINLAFEYGDKVIIEEGVENTREIELAVLGNDTVEVSVVGEIVPDREFYDYASKYDKNTKSKPIIPAQLPRGLSEKIRQAAKEAYIELGLYGLSRVDFLLNSQTNEFYINEVNTMPGFTPISMYPKLWEASGLNYKDLLTKLINLAKEKFAQKQNYKLNG